MKRAAAALALALAVPAALLADGEGARSEEDGVAACVGAEQILRSEVVSELRRLGAGTNRFSEARNALIERKLVAMAAKEAKLTLQDWVVDNRVQEVIDAAFGGDRNRLVAALAQQKLTYAEWRQRIKDDMVVAAMRWNVVEKNLAATPSEIRAEYDAHPERYAAQAKATVSVILLKPEDAAKRGEVDAAVASKGFAEAAKRFSADAHAAEGGLWKDVVPGSVFRPEICEALAKLAPGETSGWMDLDGLGVLLRKESGGDASSRTLADAYAEVEANVKAEKSARLYREWIDRLKSETFIKVF